jgi:hypothetical protein
MFEGGKMFKSKYTLAVAAVIGAFLAPAAARASIVLPGGMVSGGGWTATFPVGINLTIDTANSDEFVVTKTADFISDEGLDITFLQTSASASPLIIVGAENLTNNSGGAWSGFQFLVINTLQGNTPAAVFSGATFNQTTFSNTSIDPAKDTVTLTDGTIANGQTVNWGGPDGGQLVIDANPTSSAPFKVLDFKEIPIPGGGSVPLPAAGWMGLSGLAGGVLLAARKKVAALA